MILLFELLSKIENKLRTLLEQGVIGDYKITLRVNNKGIIFILLEDETKRPFIESELSAFNHNKIEFEILLNQEVESDPYYKELFENQNKLFLDSRKNLSNLLEIKNEKKINTKSKVVTFYSYKGGVGRSTVLASCASYLSNHYGKRILIIDCDLEAPGFTNYFLEEPSQINNHTGVVEYFLDLEYQPNNIDISNYVWEVGKDYSGAGNILVMPAGNLSDSSIKDDNIFGTHKSQYLEGLARIDTSSSYILDNKFTTLLNEVDTDLQPDIILIDSRTGFNDIFGITAFNISDLVVGLFGNNLQNIPGLNFFIDRIIESKIGLNAILLNAIISRRSSYTKFETYVENYIQNRSPSDDENIIVIKTFPLTRYDILEVIGTNDEKKDDFIDLIKNKRFPDYNEIFEYINEILLTEEIEEPEVELDIEPEQKANKKGLLSYTEELSKLTKEVISLDLNDAYTKIQKHDKFSVGVEKLIKKIIINKIENKWPKLFS